jgi:hypothetical protein
MADPIPTARRLRMEPEPRRFEDLVDEMFGVPGSDERRRLDADIERLNRRDARARLLTDPLRRLPLIGGPVSTFYYGLLYEGPRGVPDLMSLVYLGDFLFWGKPMTHDYAVSWMARFQPKRTLRRLLRGPCRASQRR